MQSDDLGLVATLLDEANQVERADLWLSLPVSLRNAAAAIERLVAERDEARELVAEANNSLYGSQGYFHSLNGGPFDKYHLANGIEELKGDSRRQWRRAVAAEALLDFATFSPWLRDWCKRRFGKWITHNTAKGALADLRARQALGDT